MSDLVMVSDFDGQLSRAGSSEDMPALLCGVETKASESGEIRTEVVASTPGVDRAGDIVEQDWRLKNFRKNPVILWMHDRMTPPVGRAVDVKSGERGKGGALTMGVIWDTSESNPLGMTVGNQYARGFLNAVSVGFLPGARTRRTELPSDDPRHQTLKDGDPPWAAGFVLSRNELLENSAVTIPANPEALAVRAWAAEAQDPRQQFQRALSETVTKADADWLLTVIDSDPRIRAKLAAILLAQPEPETPESDLEIWLRSMEPTGLENLFTAPSATTPKQG